MINKDVVISVLQELYDGKPIAFSKIKRRIKEDPEDIEKVLTELESEGLVKKYDVNGGKSYELVKVDSNTIVIGLLREIKDEIKKLEEIVGEKWKLNVGSFDEVYDKVKDNLGYASLENIRVELGLTKEEFYSRFRSYVESNYDLIAGGNEGYVRKGAVYGIVKRKKR
ncbi:hypothetical protein [Sulfolobus acidocaldarius]|uniref:Conserved protein n=4 Tax=Sulfolobus acidocaldarius TaxID=2285 RepID=Q4J9F5_SULAC|nr:hypothetical protein [Sulfolobus acidocaldarius]AAY80575.1 conserved protein [Sulfolobus acidocaldarius DSM 639]AGE71164.1 hypothetical protein SacN8_05995 [Sulfolobus acidocaldarius N8]AGE73434.1 hypothetical protein SacRon12I_05990 [Sulfolobus acidocaldarius Ron12/I]ALU28566.1 hypothetical protein ATY89_00355 [Sulfolobus acidocaldarius]ALU31278.1 hypothetical protein ATZ20_03400 [Sulfolobus acidocaldarius]